MENFKRNIDRGQEKAKSLFEETKPKDDDLIGERVYLEEVNSFQNLVDSLKIGPDAKMELYAEVDTFFREEILPLSSLGSNVVEKAAVALVDALHGKSGGDRERADQLNVKAQGLESGLSKLTDQALKKEQEEQKRLKDIDGAMNMAAEFFGEGKKLSDEANKLSEQAKFYGDEDVLKQAVKSEESAGRYFQGAITALEEQIHLYDGKRVDATPEFLAQLDKAKVLLSKLYPLSEKYALAGTRDIDTKEIDARRERLLFEVKDRQRLNHLSGTLKSVSGSFTLVVHQNRQVNELRKAGKDWEADLTSEEVGKQVQALIADLKGEIDLYDGAKIDVASEFSSRLDEAKILLSHLYKAAPGYQKGSGDVERKKLLMEVKTNTGYRAILDSVASVLKKNPQAFDDFKDFHTLLRPSNGSLTLTDKFFEADELEQKILLNRLQSRANDQANEQGLEAATGYKRDYFEGKIALAKGDIYSANQHLKKFYPILKKDAALDPREKAALMGETEFLLREIGFQKCAMLQADLQQIMSQRAGRKLVGESNINIDAANRALSHVVRALKSGKAMTFEQAWKESGIEKEQFWLAAGERVDIADAFGSYKMLFQASMVDDPAERAMVVAKAVEALDSYGGSTQAARRILDEHLATDLAGVKLDPKTTLAHLHWVAERDADIHAHKIKTEVLAEVDSLESQLEKIDKQLLRTSHNLQEYRDLKELRESLVKKLGEMRGASAEIKPSYLEERKSQVIEEHYARLVRKEKYLKLAENIKNFDPKKAEIISAAIKMDDLHDKLGNFATDSINEGIDTGAQVAFDVSTMVLGMGTGSLVKLGASKLLIRALEKGGAQAAFARAAIWSAGHGGEGLGMHTGGSTAHALLLAADGKDGSEAYDNFLAGWGHSTLMFASIGTANAGFAKVFGGAEIGLKEGGQIATREARWGTLSAEGRAEWLKYQSGQLTTEVLAMTASEHAVDSNKELSLDSLAETLFTVIKFRAGAKLVGKTLIGKEIHNAQARFEAKTRENIGRARETRAMKVEEMAWDKAIKAVKDGLGEMQAAQPAAARKKMVPEGPKKKDLIADVIDFFTGKRISLTEAERQVVQKAESLKSELEKFAKSSEAQEGRDIRMVEAERVNSIITSYLDKIFVPGTKIHVPFGVLEIKYVRPGKQFGTTVITEVNGRQTPLNYAETLMLFSVNSDLKPILSDPVTRSAYRRALLLIGGNRSLAMMGRENFDVNLRRINPRTGEMYDPGLSKAELRAKVAEGAAFVRETLTTQFRTMKECAQKADQYLRKRPNADLIELTELLLDQKTLDILSKDQIKKVELAIKGMVKRQEVIKKYEKQISKQPKAFVEEAFGIEKGGLKGPVKVIIDGGVIHIEASNRSDFAKLYGHEGAEKAGGFAVRSLQGIAELGGIITVSRDNNRSVYLHERQHQFNLLLFGEHLDATFGFDSTPITRAKDEVIAYLRDGSSLERIFKTLTDQEGLYDYFANEKKEADREKFGYDPHEMADLQKRWEQHVGKVRRMLEQAENVRDKDGNIDVDLLAITPHTQWKWLSDGGQRKLAELNPPAKVVEQPGDGGIAHAARRTPERDAVTGGVDKVGTRKELRRLLVEKEIPREVYNREIKKLDLQVLKEKTAPLIELVDGFLKNNPNARNKEVLAYLFANGGIPGGEAAFKRHLGFEGMRVIKKAILKMRNLKSTSAGWENLFRSRRLFNIWMRSANKSVKKELKTSGSEDALPYYSQVYAKHTRRLKFGDIKKVVRESSDLLVVYVKPEKYLANGLDKVRPGEFEGVIFLPEGNIPETGEHSLAGKKMRHDFYNERLIKGIVDMSGGERVYDRGKQNENALVEIALALRSNEGFAAVRERPVDSLLVDPNVSGKEYLDTGAGHALIKNLGEVKGEIARLEQAGFKSKAIAELAKNSPTVEAFVSSLKQIRTPEILDAAVALAPEGVGVALKPLLEKNYDLEGRVLSDKDKVDLINKVEEANRLITLMAGEIWSGVKMPAEFKSEAEVHAFTKQVLEFHINTLAKKAEVAQDFAANFKAGERVNMKGKDYMIMQVKDNGQVLLGRNVPGGGETKVVEKSEVLQHNPVKETLERAMRRAPQPELTKKWVETGFKVERIVKMDGLEFHIGPVVEMSAKEFGNGSGPTEVLKMLVDKGDGVLVPRLAYKSERNNQWLVVSGYFAGHMGAGRFDGGNILPASRGRERVLSPVLAKAVEQVVAKKSLVEEGPADLLKQFGTNLFKDAENLGNYHDEVNLFDDGGALKQLKKGVQELKFFHDPDWVGKEFESMDSAFPEGFIPDFSTKPVSSEKGIHPTLGVVTYENFNARLNGEPIVWKMAHDGQGRVWIENISLKNPKTTTFGNPSELISIGVLANKPKSNASPNFDVTKFLDHLLPIRQFRAERGIERRRVKERVPATPAPTLVPRMNVVEKPTIKAPVQDVKVLDLTDRATLRAERKKLREELKAELIDEKTYRELTRALYQQRYLDLMNKVMAKSEKYLAENPDCTFYEARRELLKAEDGLKPSKKQVTIITQALEKYIKQRDEMRPLMERLKTPEGKKQFLEKVGLGHIDPSSVDLIAPDQVTIAILFKSKDAYVNFVTQGPRDYFRSKAERLRRSGKTSEDVERLMKEDSEQIDQQIARAEWSHGIYLPGRRYLDPMLDGRVIALRDPKFLDHEVDHRRFADYYNAQIYDTVAGQMKLVKSISSADIKAPEKVKALEDAGLLLDFEGKPVRDLAEKQKMTEDWIKIAEASERMLDETGSYLVGNDYRTDTISLFYKKSIDALEFKLPVSRERMKRYFETLATEIDRLHAEGIPADRVHALVRSSGSIVELIQQLRKVGTIKIGDRKTLNDQLATFTSEDRRALDVLGGVGEFDLITGLPRTVNERLQHVRFVVRDRAANLADFRELQSQLAIVAPDLAQNIGRALVNSKGEFLAWGDKLKITREYLDLINDGKSQKNPEIREHLEDLLVGNYRDVEGNIFTFETRLAAIKQFLVNVKASDKGPTHQAEVKPASEPALETADSKERRAGLEASLREAGLIDGKLPDADWKAIWEVVKTLQDGAQLSNEGRRLLVKHLKPGEGSVRRALWNEIINHARDKGFMVPIVAPVKPAKKPAAVTIVERPGAQKKAENPAAVTEPLVERKSNRASRLIDWFRRFLRPKSPNKKTAEATETLAEVETMSLAERQEMTKRAKEDVEKLNDALLAEDYNRGRLAESFKEAIRQVENPGAERLFHGESFPHTQELVKSLKERDPIAYEILKSNDTVQLVNTEVIVGLIRGEKIEFKNENGESVLAYRGRALSRGGYGKVARVGYLVAGSKELRFGVVKEALQLGVDTPQEASKPGNTDYNLLAKQKLKEEARAQEVVAGLKIPGLIKVLEASDRAIIYESSMDAASLTKKEDSMSARESCQSLKEVMEAVEAMHAKGLIHADIKPDNILLMTDQNGVKRTKLIDITPLAMRDFFQTKSVTAHYYFTKEMIRKAESDLINSGMRDPRKRSEVLSRGHDTYSLAIVVGEVLLPKLKSIEGPKTPQKVAELEAHVKKITEDAVFAGDPRALARMKMLVGKLMTTLE